LSKHGLKLLDSQENTKILVLPTTVSLNKNDLFTDSTLIHALLNHANTRVSYKTEEHSPDSFANHSKKT